MKEEEKIRLDIKAICDKYSFLNIKSDSLKDIINLEVERSLKIVEKDPTLKFSIILKKSLEERFKIIMGKLLKKKQFTFIENLLKKMEITDDTDLAFCELEQFLSYFDDTAFDEELYSTLLNYNEIFLLVELLSKNNIATNNIRIKKLIKIYRQNDFRDYEPNFNNFEGIFWKNIKDYPVLGEEETKMLLEKAHLGDKAAQDKIVLHNQRLIMFVIRKHYISFTRAISYYDLFQEGVLGLIRAINKYDPKLYASFANYAIIWINNMIGRYIKDNISIISSPYRIKEMVRKFKNYIKEYYIANGKEPSIKDIAKEFSLTENRALEIMNYISMMGVQSLDMTTTDDDKSSIYDVIKDPNVDVLNDTIDLTIHKDLIKLIDDSPLTDNEVLTLIMRYNLDGRGYRTLERVALLLGGMTRENVRKMQDYALKILKRASLPLRLDEYLELNNGMITCDDLPKERKRNKRRTLSFKDAIKKIEELEKECSVNLGKSIFDYLGSDVNASLILNSLNDKEKAFVYHYFGENLEKRILNSMLGKTEKTILNGKIIPKIKKKLKDK